MKYDLAIRSLRSLLAKEEESHALITLMVAGAPPVLKEQLRSQLRTDLSEEMEGVTDAIRILEQAQAMQKSGASQG